MLVKNGNIFEPGPAIINHPYCSLNFKTKYRLVQVYNLDCHHKVPIYIKKNMNPSFRAFCSDH